MMASKVGRDDGMRDAAGADRGQTGRDKGKTTAGGGGLGAALASSGKKSFDKAVNPGNQNLGLAGANYTGPRGQGTGVDPSNASNRAAKGTEGGSAGTKSAP